jgi:hypothetical protein
MTSTGDGSSPSELDGIICTGETYRDKVEITFAPGAAVAHNAVEDGQALASPRA